MRALHLLIFALLLSLAAVPAFGQEATADEKASSEQAPSEKAPPEAASEGQPTQELPAPSDGKAAAAKVQAQAEARANAKAQVKNAGDDCPGGVSFDDGGPEIGYGFVDSTQWGILAQRYEASLFPSREITTVCICLRQGGGLEAADFEIVFYEEQDERPAEEPYATVAASAQDIPFMQDEEPGRFYAIEIKASSEEGAGGVMLRGDATYIGARFKPTATPRFAVCGDKSKASTPVQGFQRDDRAKGWDDLLTTRDWTYADHKAMMIRAIAKAAPAKEAKESSDSE